MDLGDRLVQLESMLRRVSPPEPTVPLKAALAAIGLAEDTATNWSRRGVGVRIPPSGRGRGRERQITARDVTKLAIMKIAAETGLGLTQCGNLASVGASRLHDRGAASVQLLHMRRYPDNLEFSFDDDEQLKADLMSSVIINVGRIERHVRDALAPFLNGASAAGKNRPRRASRPKPAVAEPPTG